jgi:ACS family sodium-dependent inorganic phosphate cotransporter
VQARIAVRIAPQNDYLFTRVSGGVGGRWRIWLDASPLSGNHLSWNLSNSLRTTTIIFPFCRLSMTSSRKTTSNSRHGAHLLLLTCGALLLNTRQVGGFSSSPKIGGRKVGRNLEVYASRRNSNTQSATASRVKDRVSSTVAGRRNVEVSSSRDTQWATDSRVTDRDSAAGARELITKQEITNRLVEQTVSKSIVANEILARDEQRKYIMLGLLWVVACLSAMDRVAMSVALISIAAEYDFSDTVVGSISSLFSVGYGLAILPAGLIISSLSPRLVMAVGLATWSIATIATPFSIEYSMTALLCARALVGAGESVILPTIQRLLQTWTTPQEKSTALAAIFSGFHAGTIAAYVLSPLIMDECGGWRGLFVVYGMFGLAILAPWLAFARDGPESKQQQALPIQVATSPSWDATLDQARQTLRDVPWKDFAASKGTWAMVLAHCAKNWGLYMTLAWTPMFYSQQYDIGVHDSALLSVLPSITGAVGGIVAGTAADWLLKTKVDNDENRTLIRKWFQSIAFLGPALALGALAYNIPEEPIVAQTYLMVVIGLQSFNAGGYEAGNQEKAGERWSGLLYSLTSLPAVLFGTAGVYITGRVLDVTHQDWSYVFGMNAGVNVLGALAFATLYNSKREFD